MGSNFAFLVTTHLNNPGKSDLFVSFSSHSRIIGFTSIESGHIGPKSPGTLMRVQIGSNSYNGNDARNLYSLLCNALVI
jgi:hypothetical protein